MNDLAEGQALFVSVLQQGPAAFPEDLFAGDPARALLGLKAHANTITHARLVALEDTYPRTLAHIGHEAFNTLSRAFIEQPEVRKRKLMRIGEGFSCHLEHHAPGSLAPRLAAIEWAWLESYHAADIDALQLADLARYDEAGLLALSVVLHPATRIVEASGSVAALVPELAGSQDNVAAILVTRPHETVLLQTLGDLQVAIALSVKNCASMGNLLQFAIETLGEAEALPAVFALIEAGALARPGD
jgi:hypothetical protein